LLKWRNLVCLPLIVILPVSLLADDAAGAMLRSDGVGVFVNKNPAPASIALFPHDLVETQKNASARLEAAGSSADINPETMVTFEGDELVLDHGSVSVNTSRGLRVRVGCVTITPVTDAEWTRYQVADVDGKVDVSALKKNVYIDARSRNLEPAKQSTRSSRTIVREGEQKSRTEKCGGEDTKESQRLPGIDGILNSPYAIATGAGLIVGVTCWALCRGSAPLSPEVP
jgi:hypothetical protein